MDWRPDVPEHWTDQEWQAWLAENAPVEDGLGPAPDPPPQPTWRKAGLGVQLMAAAMVGLEEALYGPREKPPIVIDASGDPDDDPFDVRLDPDHPERSVVVVRPWLRRPPAGPA